MIKSLSSDTISNFLIEFFIAFLILFSPLIYGSVNILQLSIVESLAFIILLLVISKLLLVSDASLFKVFLSPLIILVIFIIFQIVKLPEGLLSTVSPATISLYKDFGFAHTGNFSLSICPDMSVHLLLQLLACVAVFYAVLNYVDTEQKSKRIITVIVISGFLYSLFGIIRKFYLPETAFSTFANRNHFSAYAQMVVPLAVSLALLMHSQIRRILLMFGASVMILAIFYAWSRAGRISLMLSMVIFFALFRLKKPGGKFGWIFIALGIFIFIFAGIMGFAPLLNRFDTLNSPLQAYADRFTIVKDTLSLIRDFPVFGTGFGTYAEIIQKYKTSTVQISYVFSHNEPLQLLAEVGLAGFFLISLFFLVSFYRIFTLWLKRRNDFAVFVTLACMVSLISIVMHSLFDFVFHVPAISVLFFIILALAFRASSTSVNKTNKDELCRKLVLAKPLRFVIMGVFLIVALFLESLISSRCRAQLILERENNRKMGSSEIEAVLIYKKSIRNIDKAILLNPLNSLYNVKRGDLVADLASKEIFGNGLEILEDFGSRQELLSGAEKYYKKAVVLNPTRADNHLRLGWLYSASGDLVLAQDEFRKALLLDPQNKLIKKYIDNLVNK